MSETQQETVIWTLPHLYAWMHRHVDEGHVLQVRSPDDADHQAGMFVCTCGAALDVRPVAANDPTSGLYAVTGAKPVTSGFVPPPAAPTGIADVVAVQLPSLTPIVKRLQGAVAIHCEMWLSVADCAQLHDAIGQWIDVKG